MAVRPVMHLPAPVLQQRAIEVDTFDDEFQVLVTDLVDAMRASPACVGLAANQIGVARRVFVVDVTGHPQARSCAGEIVLVNPTIVEARALLHELDHLDGRLFLDRVASSTSVFRRRVYR